MFRIQKIRGFSRVASLSAAAALFSTLSFAGAGAADADGDRIPDEADPAPLLADLPFRWSVRSVSLQFFPDEARTNAFRMALREERAPVRLARPSGMTAPPSSAGDRAGGPAASGLFGDGSVPWGRLERDNASRALGSMAALPPGAPVDFTFVVRFTGTDAAGWRLARLSAPVELGGRAWATASPADGQARERGFLLPGGGAARDVPFSATMTASTARKFLERLSKGGESPDLALVHARGAEISDASGRVSGLDAKLESILARTAPVRVEGPAGQSWCWRVAARRPDGKRTTIADWADAANRASGASGPPAVSFSKDGYLLSLAGWDTGTWDDWWQASVRGKDLEDLDWRPRDCGRGVRFYLRHRPPAFSGKDRERCMAGSRTSPVYPMLLGVRLWNEGDKEGSRRYFREAAAAGWPQAYSWLGFALASDDAFPSNAFCSASSYRRAADLEYAPGETWYGNCLLRGKGVKADARAAIPYLKRAAGQRYPEGQALYGLCLLRGVGTRADPEAALEILVDASLRGDPTAQLGLGAYLLEKRDPGAVVWLRLAAEGGNQRARLKLAGLLRDGGPGIPADPAGSVGWYEAAADHGSALALVALGEACRAGSGVRRNDRKAAGYFRRAAEMGDRRGQTWLALCLLDGAGVPQDPAEAADWLEKAAKQGSPEAQYMLGICLHGGFGGIPQDKTAAVRWFEAAAPSLENARVFLGYCYFAGDGVGRDKARAARIFEESARAGSAAGQLWLSYCFANGEGVTIDFAQARKWAEAAAKQGSAAGKALLRTLPRD